MRSHQSLTKEESWAFLPVLLIFYSAEYYFIDNIHPDIAPWISLGFAAILIGLYILDRKRAANTGKLK